MPWHEIHEFFNAGEIRCILCLSRIRDGGAVRVKGTTIHNFFSLDINSRTSLEKGTVEASVVKKTNVIIIDEFSMVDYTIIYYNRAPL